MAKPAASARISSMLPNRMRCFIVASCLQSSASRHVILIIENSQGDSLVHASCHIRAFARILTVEAGEQRSCGMARIFISYSRKDEAFSRRLAASLSQLGADVWIDVEDIPSGMKWSRAIQEGLDVSDV